MVAFSIYKAGSFNQFPL